MSGGDRGRKEAGPVRRQACFALAPSYSRLQGSAIIIIISHLITVYRLHRLWQTYHVWKSTLQYILHTTLPIRYSYLLYTHRYSIQVDLNPRCLILARFWVLTATQITCKSRIFLTKACPQPQLIRLLFIMQPILFSCCVRLQSAMRRSYMGSHSPNYARNT